MKYVSSMKWTARISGLAALGFIAAIRMQGVQAAPQAAGQDALPQTIEFNRDIRPILSDKCFQCHGPGTQMATLRFDLEDGAKHALRGGRFAIVPGDPDKSELIQRVTATNPAVRMPRSRAARQRVNRSPSGKSRCCGGGSNRARPGRSTGRSFRPLRPALPKVTDDKWVRNPIDAFVLQRLEREGLKPSPEADRATLLRRVTLDLTGLPPTPAEVDAFLATSRRTRTRRSSIACCASPRYGERMAVPVARRGPLRRHATAIRPTASGSCGGGATG